MTEAMQARIDTTADLSAYFDFSPSTKGVAKLSGDKRFIDFQPDKSLKPGKKYECRVNMHDLVRIDSLGDFKFDFVVDKRELKFEDVVASVDPDDISMITISGRMEYNVQAGDTITADKSIINCDYPNAVVTVSKDASKNSRSFVITGIKRKAKTSYVKIQTNPMFGFSKAEETIEIPGIEDFKLLNSERIKAVEPYINLNFSAPLSPQQELDGLITIDKINELRIEREGCNVKVFYPQNGISDITLRLSELIKNNEGRCLDEDAELHFKQEVIPPAVEIPVEGTILPDNDNLKLPFRAVNLAAVDVEVVKIFPSNVMAFLQENDLDGSYELRRFGRLIYQKTVRLDKDKSLNLNQWQNFAIDLKGLFKRERGSIYNVRISFRKAYSLYNRAEPERFEEVAGISDDEKRIWDRDRSYIYRENPDYDWRNCNWNERNDPAKASYYMYADMPEINLVASTLGLIVKKGADNEYVTIVTDLISANPASGINVTAYNYQLQKTASATTDSNGFATLKTEGNPFMITASDSQCTTYLKVSPGRELSTSNFDVSGKVVVEGVKGFTYGDRGVWRPGDDVHLTLILEDKSGKLPENHPVVMDLYNPSDQLYASKTLTEGVDGFYVFNIQTEENVPTGTWDAQFKVGNQTFHHKVRIETIKPNRLKLNITVPEVIQANTPQEIGLTAHWLTGSVAKNMAASMEIALFSDPNPFKGFKNYTFSNPLLDFSSSQKQILQGQLDSIGCLKQLCTIGADINSPGMLRANVTTKVTEPGGDASITSKSVQFSPFGVYVGIDLSNNEYLTNTDLKLPVVVVNQKGARMKSRELTYKIYRLDWDWWWEGSADDLNRYVKSSSANLVANGTVSVTNGYATIPFRADYADWGKYLVLVRDTKGGHATGGTIMIDCADWNGQSDRKEAAGSTELSFTLNKKTYEAGETANVYLPKCKGGKVLLSIENGNRVLKRYWVNTSADKETCFKLPIEGSMAPNFYVAATMLRPHTQTSNDVPIRLFGVVGATVIDKRTILHPVIDMPDELHPQQTFAINVREEDNKPMTYTLALVDEGLLDITNFKTPRPWPAMNQREALGVKTWDMYDDVIGAFGSKFRTILSIGGDEALRKAAGKEKRFNPVVKFIGPFTLTIVR
ncbi:MAG: MG2 domain-containing protein [Muribaculum sp.]|nr:MG2 domain-containing protein [Muribaculum sp.]